MQSAARYFKILPSELRLETTLKCGQSFRWVRVTSPEPASIAFRGAFHDRVVTLVQTATRIGYSSVFAEDYTGLDDTQAFLEDYLNLAIDLEKLYKEWSAKDKHFSETSKRFLGLRMLRQDPFENLISFICSSNNNISRITQMVQNLCKHYGKYIAEADGVAYYTFPRPESLMHSTLTDELRALGFGYRAKFIAATVQQLSELPPDHLHSLREKSYEEAHEDLMQFMGVGAKVADCVCLMSLDKTQAVPIDTHVLQIAQRDYKFKAKGSSMTKLLYDNIKKFFIELWGPYAGWAHSVLFVADLRAFQDESLETWNHGDELAIKLEGMSGDPDADVPKLEVKINTPQPNHEETLTMDTVVIKTESTVLEASIADTVLEKTTKTRKRIAVPSRALSKRRRVKHESMKDIKTEDI